MALKQENSCSAKSEGHNKKRGINTRPGRSAGSVSAAFAAAALAQAARVLAHVQGSPVERGAVEARDSAARVGRVGELDDREPSRPRRTFANAAEARHEWSQLGPPVRGGVARKGTGQLGHSGSNGQASMSERGWAYVVW